MLKGRVTMEEIRLPVPIQTMMIIAPTGTIFYPQVQWLKSRALQNKINHGILNSVYQMFMKAYQHNYMTKITGEYEVKNNQRGIISIIMTNIATGPTLSHPVENLTAFTTDIQTGKTYSLSELFKPNTPYIKRLSAIVKHQIDKRQLKAYQDFTSIRPNQDFYIADKTLVLFFQRFEIAPNTSESPIFPISIYEIADILKENGPLGKLLPDY